MRCTLPEDFRMRRYTCSSNKYMMHASAALGESEDKYLMSSDFTLDAFPQGMLDFVPVHFGARKVL
jgi:hypothetical protein